MKIFSAEQKREIDFYTIEKEPIASIDLMERAATAIMTKLLQIIQNIDFSSIIIVAGQGNNGGDGLALTRLLLNTKEFENIQAFYCKFSNFISSDCKINLEILCSKYPNNISIVENSDKIVIPDKSIIIDALFGTGLNRPVTGEYAKLINKINRLNVPVISIDIPSGFFSEMSADASTVAVRADHTLCIDSPVLSALLPENQDYFGKIHIVDIQLSKVAKENTPSNFEIIEFEYVKSLLKKRKRFDHKGIYGHCLLISGSYGKAGAAILAAKAAIRSGVGLLSLYVPEKIIQILQTVVPEAMCVVDELKSNNIGINISPYSAIGIGPGIGVNRSAIEMVKFATKTSLVPIVVDADAINCLAQISNFSECLKPGYILTPHPKEFERMFGKFSNTLEIIKFLKDFSSKTGVVIVYKTGITIISTPEGKILFNILGNPGMATGGSGDVLTGLISGLLAQKYCSVNAAIMGVFVHALSGDLAAKVVSMNSLVASDIINFISNAFLEIEKSVY